VADLRLLCTDLRAEAAAARAEAAAARAEAQRQQSEFARVVKERDRSRGLHLAGVGAVRGDGTGVPFVMAP
jgi:septal ring factor EnvC (AmiA/AmiB activator)